MEQLRLTGWMTIFGALAVLATGVAWRVAAVAVVPHVDTARTELALFVTGLLGPILVVAAAWWLARPFASCAVVRAAASAGVAVVVAAELAFFVPIGMLCTAVNLGPF
jgi:hypothetical protein